MASAYTARPPLDQQAKRRSRADGHNAGTSECRSAAAVGGLMPVHERTQAAALGEGPLAMFDDGLPLKFLHGPQSTTGVGAMEFSSKHEDEWLSRATDAAIAGARKIALGNGPLTNTPVGRLTDHEWDMIVTAVIFGWVEVRVQQAIAEGLDQEQTVRVTGLKPDPCDIAVVRSI